MAQALQWRWEWQRRKTERMRAKREAQRIAELALQAVYKGTGKGKLELWQGSELEREGWQRMHIVEDRSSWQSVSGKKGSKGQEKGGQKVSGKKGSKGQEKGGKGDTRKSWTCGKTGHIAA